MQKKPRARSAAGNRISERSPRRTSRRFPNPEITHKRAGRWVDQPKPEHVVVLRATEIANLAFRRAVSVEEILAALTTKETEMLETAYENALSAAVSKILQLLRARGTVFSAGKVGTRYYYGVAGVLDPAAVSLPADESQRRRALELARRAVASLGRAVRNADVLEYAASSPEYGDFPPEMITRSVLSLRQTGELRVVGSVRGDGRGINLYLPAELNPKDYPLEEPVTWLEEVAHTFKELWGEREAQAMDAGRKPYPLSTGEVRERLRSSSRYTENVSDPMVLVNAMQQLARTRNPVLRKIRRPKQRAVLWVPAGVDDAAIDAGDAYASDIERVSEAVRRAEIALGRPATLRDVQDQLDLDPPLRLTGSSRLITVLADAAKERICSGKGGGRRKRVAQRVHRVGKVSDVSYYSTSRTPEAETFIGFKRLELRWSAMRVEEEVEALRFCSLPTAAIGRAMLALAETTDAMNDLNDLRCGGSLRGEQRRAAEKLLGSMEKVAGVARSWLEDHASNDSLLLESVNRDVPGWTIDDLLEVIGPLYPRARTIKKSSHILGLMGDTIRRFPNPEYVNRFSLNQRVASEYLFDRTDALLYAAKEWGGHECCLQATLARNELGHLRDPRFVLPAADSEDFNTRLSAVACLAFLRCEAGNERLLSILANDPDPGVRQSALWAYGFSGAADAQEILASRSKEDADVRVRAFAHELLRVSQDSWWSS